MLNFLPEKTPFGHLPGCLNRFEDQKSQGTGDKAEQT